MTTAVAEAPPNGHTTEQQQSTAVAAPQKTAPPARQMIPVQDDGPLAFIMDTARFEHLYRIAAAMAASSFLPEHLTTTGPKNNKTLLHPDKIKANCFLIVNQALRWGVDPFALAPETYVVQNKLGYQGKLVAAIVNTRAGLRGRLTVAYDGQGIDRTITVSGQFKDEEFIRTIDLSVRQAKTDNQMWTTDPDQKLWYSAVTKWARRHCPEVLLGVLTDDDVERFAAARPQSTAIEHDVTGIEHASRSDALAAELQARVQQSNGGEVDAPPPAETVVEQVDDSRGEETQVDPDETDTAAFDRLKSRISVSTRHTEIHEITEAAKALPEPDQAALKPLIEQRSKEIDELRRGQTGKKDKTLV